MTVYQDVVALSLGILVIHAWSIDKLLREILHQLKEGK